MPMTSFQVAAQTKRDDKNRVQYPSPYCCWRLLFDTWLKVNKSFSIAEKSDLTIQTAVDAKL